MYTSSWIGKGEIAVRTFPNLNQLVKYIPLFSAFPLPAGTSWCSATPCWVQEPRALSTRACTRAGRWPSR